METALIIALTLGPMLFAVGLAAQHENRRYRRAIRAFAELLEGGKAAGGVAVGRWDGVELTVRHVHRMQPPQTFVEVRLVATPLALVMQPRRQQDLLLNDPLPVGRRVLDNIYVTEGAPRALVPALFDERAESLLLAVTETHLALTPGFLRVRHRHALYEAYEVKPLIELAAHLARRVQAVTREEPRVAVDGDPYRPAPDPDAARRLEEEAAAEVSSFVSRVDSWLVAAPRRDE